MDGWVYWFLFDSLDVIVRIAFQSLFSLPLGKYRTEIQLGTRLCVRIMDFKTWMEAEFSEDAWRRRKRGVG